MSQGELSQDAELLRLQETSLMFRDALLQTRPSPETSKRIRRRLHTVWQQEARATSKQAGFLGGFTARLWAGALAVAALLLVWFFSPPVDNSLPGAAQGQGNLLVPLIVLTVGLIILGIILWRNRRQ